MSYLLNIAWFPGGESRISVVKDSPPRPLVDSVQNGTPELEPVSGSEKSGESLEFAPVPGREEDLGKSPPRFTLVGKRKLKRYVAAMADECPKSQTRFATATFPAFSPEAKRVLAEQASYFNDRIQSWLYKRSPKIAWAYCWEFQKRGTLHCHWVLACSDVSVILPTTDEWRDEVARLITAMSVRGGTNLWVGAGFRDWSKNPEKLRADCQEVRKSVAAYLTKYLSKGESKEKGGWFYPKRWWGASAIARDWCEKLSGQFCVSMGTFQKVAAKAESLLGELESLCEARFKYMHKFSRGWTWVCFGRELVEECKCILTRNRNLMLSNELTKSQVDGALNALSLLRKNQELWALCYRNSSQPVRMVMKCFMSQSLTSQHLDGCVLLELKLLVCAFSRNNRERLTLSRLLSRGSNNDKSDMPELRTTDFDGVPLSGCSDRRDEQLSLI